MSHIPAIARTFLPALLIAALAAPSALARQATPPQPSGGGPLEVEVSIFVLDVKRILDAEQSVEADLAYRLAWRDERLAAEGEQLRVLELESIWHPTMQPVSPRGLTPLMPEVAYVEPDGRVSYTQRLYGQFGMTTNLHDFPLDRHDLGFRFAIPNRQKIDMALVPGELVGVAGQLSIPDWTIRGGRLDLAPMVLSEALPPMLSAGLVLRAERNLSHYLTKVILPLIVIVMISWTVFWAPPPQIAVQFGFAATSILTVIAYRFALASQLPPVPYSTRLDNFLNGAFILVALALVEVVVTAQLIYKERVADALKVDIVCRAVFPIALALIAGYSFFL